MVTVFFPKDFCIFVYVANSLEIVKNEKRDMGAKTGSIYHIRVFFASTNKVYNKHENYTSLLSLQSRTAR